MACADQRAVSAPSRRHRQYGSSVAEIFLLLPTPQKVMDVLKNVILLPRVHSPSQGYRSLREALVNYYERYQIKVECE